MPTNAFHRSAKRRPRRRSACACSLVVVFIGVLLTGSPIGSGRGFGIRTIAWTRHAHLALTSSRPGHTGVSPHPPERKSWCSTGIAVEHTPLVGALALHGVSGQPIGSHLGSTLKPGRAVLTRGVFRRSGSVACVRADASPTEVLAAFHVGTAIGARQTEFPEPAR